MPSSDEVTLVGMVMRELGVFRSEVNGALQAMRSELATANRDAENRSREAVSRAEYEQRRDTVDDRLKSLDRRLSEELASRRLPWPSVLAAIASLVALVVSLGDRLYGGPLGP